VKRPLTLPRACNGRNATMSRLLPRRRWLGAYLTYACMVLLVGNASTVHAVNDKDCTGKSPGCVNQAYCNSPSTTKPGYDCEEGYPIPFKYCEDSYGKDCPVVSVYCGRINYWSGGPCLGGRCDGIIFNFADLLDNNNGC
jgi:hypothetical protein